MAAACVVLGFNAPFKFNISFKGLLPGKACCCPSMQQELPRFWPHQSAKVQFRIMADFICGDRQNRIPHIAVLISAEGLPFFLPACLNPPLFLIMIRTFYLSGRRFEHGHDDGQAGPFNHQDDTRILFMGALMLIFLSIVVMTVVLAAKWQGAPSIQVPRSTVLYDGSGKQMGETHYGQKRYWVSLKNINPAVIDATLAVEDRNFSGTTALTI
ncbi:hypothetical protein PO124_05290 [Bacillus licheniformis]|nr:hypothetical protein [Bacillus licheniformis]